MVRIKVKAEIHSHEVGGKPCIEVKVWGSQGGIFCDVSGNWEEGGRGLLRRNKLGCEVTRLPGSGR